MSQIQQISEQIQNIGTFSLEDARNHAAIIGMSVLPAALLVSGVDYFRHPEAKNVGLEGADPIVLDEVKDVKGSHFKAHRRRWGIPLVAAAGVSLLAANYMEPVITVDEVDAHSATMLVVDQSYPMKFTLDMDNGVSRSNAVEAAITNATNDLSDKVRIGAVTYGATNEVPAQSQLGTDRGGLIAGISGSAVDPNGLNVANALKTTSDVFAGNSDATSENVVILTDGLVDNIDATRERLKAMVEADRNVTVIITGTADGSYKRTTYDVESTKAGATPNAYSGVEGVNVVTATDTKTLTKELKDTIKSTTTKNEKKPFILFTKAGEALLGIAFLGTIVKAFKRSN